MRDRDLIQIATEYRNGLLGGRSSLNQCAIVTYSLCGFLRMCGVECETEEPPEGHVYLRLADGRVLDATADQFNDRLEEHGLTEPLPPVYLGPSKAIHAAA